MDNYNSTRRNAPNNSIVLPVVVILALLLLGFIVYAAMTNKSLEKMLGAYNSSTTNNYVVDDAENSINSNDTNSNSEKTDDTNGMTDTSATPESNQFANDDQTAFAVKVADLSSNQQAVLKVAGFSATDEIVITNKMKACAESSIGTERTAAMAQGDKPTFTEGAQLLICYNE